MKKYMQRLWLWGALCLAVASCQKDPLEDIESGAWNKERNIIGISFKGQIGGAEIIREGEQATINFVCNADDIGGVELTAMELSIGAKASTKPGDRLNFNNSDHTAVITVTSATGQSMDWIVKAEPFVNPYMGTWKINHFFCKYDDWNGWGLAGEGNVSDLMPAVAKGMDDIVVFGSAEGTDAEGAVYGSYERTAGADGAFGTYVSVAGGDWAFKFGQLPAGKGTYYINPDNTISIEIEGTGKRFKSKGITSATASSVRYELESRQIWDINWDDYYCTENKLRVAYQIWCDLSPVE